MFKINVYYHRLDKYIFIIKKVFFYLSHYIATRIKDRYP